MGREPTTGGAVAADPTTPGTTEDGADGGREAWRQARATMEESPWAWTVIGRRRKHSRKFGLSEDAIIGLLRAAGLHRRGVANAVDLRLAHVELRHPDLPAAFDGYTILHLSDAHVGTLPGGVERAAALVRGLEVDLAVLTGDVQTRGFPAADEAGRRLEPLLKAFRARDGVIAILGNHDCHRLPEVLEGLGARVLINERMAITRGDDRLHFVGIDDVRYFLTEGARTLLAEPPAGFSVALVHSPELAGEAERAGHALYLTGHTHGGQISLPGGRPLMTATYAHKSLPPGVWRLGRLVGHTSRGIGTGVVPYRFNCRGEVSVLRLVRGP